MPQLVAIKMHKCWTAFCSLLDEAVITKYVTTAAPFGHLNYCEWFLDAMPYLHAAHVAVRVSFIPFLYPCTKSVHKIEWEVCKGNCGWFLCGFWSYTYIVPKVEYAMESLFLFKKKRIVISRGSNLKFKYIWRVSRNSGDK